MPVPPRLMAAVLPHEGGVGGQAKPGREGELEVDPSTPLHPRCGV
jgi:hypothetical protein